MLGYLDDVVIVPLGILLVVKLIPPPLMAEFRQKALRQAERPTSRIGALVIIVIWIAAFTFTLWAFWPAAVPSCRPMRPRSGTT